jgi:two-component system, cell cycle sensor histidine kinase and response regulator CckA
MGEHLDERAIFVRGPVVLFRWRNAEGWPVEYVSPNAHEVFGHASEAFTSGEISYASLIVSEDAERVGQEVAAAAGSDVPAFVHEPYRIRHPDGRVRWLYDSTRVLRNEKGEATHFLGYVIDITARVEAEDQARELERRLLHAQKLESLGVLAGGVAHDFNNLLTGILGQASLARRRLADQPVPTGLESALGQIETLSRRAADLTRQLLAYSGRGSFVKEPIDLGDVVRETVSMLGVTVPKTATLDLELAPGLPAIEADRTQMQQIAMNLLTNAGEALGGARGRVVLRTYVEECSEETLRDRYDTPSATPGTYVALEVADTGIGMDALVQAKLFDPFFTTKGAGRGLGMSAVQGIVRGHAGLVRVTSEPGQGTTFTVLFPARAGKRVTPPAPSRARQRKSVGTVLVVDDQASIRVTLQSLLTDFGYRVVLASEGAEALAQFSTHRDEIVAVILDLTMPGMSGPETLEALRKRAPSLPVILSSGFSEGDMAATPGATAFLQKPFGADELERILADAIRPR